jgi:hypothetical protein
MLLSSAALANDVSFSVDVPPNVHVTGTVDVDDSSGDINSVKGEVSGAVSGSFQLDPLTPQMAIGQGPRLTLHFDRRNQQVSAQLDGGNTVTLWEKP